MLTPSTTSSIPKDDKEIQMSPGYALAKGRTLDNSIVNTCFCSYSVNTAKSKNIIFNISSECKELL